MPFQLWPDPRDGLDPGESPWNWEEVGRIYGGKTKTPPSKLPGWERWYFSYKRPDGSRVKISADRDPQTGEWFNPHPSSKQ
jgi:hypothetical protein